MDLMKLQTYRSENFYKLQAEYIHKENHPETNYEVLCTQRKGKNHSKLLSRNHANQKRLEQNL